MTQTEKHSEGHHRGVENLTCALSIVTIVTIVGLIASLIGNSYLIPSVLPMPSATRQTNGPMLRPAHGSKSHELQLRFDQAIAMLHAKQFDFAIKALDKVIMLAPKMPEAYVNLGFALVGLEQYKEASQSFNKATQLKVDQANAYWGLALASEGLKDYEGALGAMRAYIHLSKPEDPFLPKARSALWEWEARLGRISGVTEQPDGTLKKDP